MDLSALSLSDLNKLQTQVSREIERRTNTAKRDLMKKIKKLAEEEGVSLEDVLKEAGVSDKPVRTRGPGKKKTAAAKKAAGKSKLPPKYRHPQDASIGWSGHGRRPQWVLDWLAAGKPLDDLLAKG